MANINKHVECVREQIIKSYKPNKIILFSSIAKGIHTENSDIDLCIVKDTENKRERLTNMYVDIECEIPFDLVLYTIEEWNKYVEDKSTFAYVINNTGVEIYG